MRLTMCIAHQDDEARWTKAAVEGLVGQTPNLVVSGGSTEAKIVRAWLDGDRVMVEVES